MVFVLIIMVSLAGVSWVLFSSKEALHRIENGDATGNKQVFSPHFPEAQDRAASTNTILGLAAIAKHVVCSTGSRFLAAGLTVCPQVEEHALGSSHTHILETTELL